MVKFDIRYMLMLRSVQPLRLYAYKVFWLRFANRYIMHSHTYIHTYIDKYGWRVIAGSILDQFPRWIPSLVKLSSHQITDFLTESLIDSEQFLVPGPDLLFLYLDLSPWTILMITKSTSPS